MFQSPFKVAFSIFGFDIKMYSVIILIALVCAIFVTTKIAKKYYLVVNKELLSDFFPMLIISSIIGARLYYVLINFKYYSNHVNEIIAVWQGGISIHGAIIGGTIAGLIFFKWRKLRFLPYADVISYGLVLGQAIGRWGNFFNSEAFGLPTDLPWKLYIAPEYRPIQYYTDSYFHPTFLYECIWDIFVFLILFLYVRRIQNGRWGLVFYSYITLYSIGRFFIEAIRIDSVLNVGEIPVAQVVSIIAFIIGVIGIIYSLKKAPDFLLDA